MSLPIQTTENRVYKTENIISTLLRTGVLASLTCIVAGTLIIFLRHPEYFSSRAQLQHLTLQSASFPHSLRDVFNGIKTLEGQAIVAIGLLLLIATPVMRVAVSILIFLHQRDRIFTLITAVVLCFLLASFVLGR